MLQRRVVQSQRCSSTPAHVHLQPNHYRPRRRRARRQILSSPRRLDPTIAMIEYYFVLYLQHVCHDVTCKPSIPSYFCAFFTACVHRYFQTRERLTYAKCTIGSLKKAVLLTNRLLASKFYFTGRNPQFECKTGCLWKQTRARKQTAG